jgi:lipopolysaccharide transport system ATP-binding protein
MYYGITDISRNILGKKTNSTILRKNEFWAIDNISFHLKKGEALGIIGANGSGKSTLLKMLNGIYWPDKGKISVKGRVGALIEVGAGFHPLLTGRENIYVNGAILGMTKQEINLQFDSIVDFSGIEEFLDTPVKHYSSGMYVRLGFAIAAHCHPDILLIDEILAVGDIGFRQKCYNFIESIKKDCSIVLVSHDMFQIGRVSTNVLLMQNGKQKYFGESEQGILEYYNLFNSSSFYAKTKTEGTINLKDFDLTLIGNDQLSMTFHIQKLKEAEKIRFILSITFVDSKGYKFAHINSLFNNKVFQEENKILCIIPELNLNTGKYLIDLVIYDEFHSKYFSMYKNIGSFSIKKDYIAGANIHYDRAIWKSGE